MCPSDDDCVNICLKGRPDAFRQLVLRYQQPVMSYLTKRLSNVDAAEEITQESFVRAYFQLNKLKQGDAFFSWLLGIAHRVMMEGFRRHRRERNFELIADPVDPSTEVELADDLDLAAAIERLPDVYQAVIILRYFGGLSCGEVSQRLGVPLGTVTKSFAGVCAAAGNDPRTPSCIRRGASMNCEECNQQLLALVEDVLDESSAREVQDHLTGCSGCRIEAKAMDRLREQLIEAGDAPRGRSFDQAVMDQILIQQVELTRRLKMARNVHVFVMGGIAAALLIGVTWAALQLGPAPAAAEETEILARGIEAASSLKSIYIQCRMRTLPSDNFSSLDLKHEFVDVELWKQFGPPLKWRVDKPGRVAAMDGRQTIMLIDNRMGVKIDQPAPSAFDTEWLQRLAAIDGVLSRELTTISLRGASVEKGQIERPDAADVTIVVDVDTSNQVGDYLNNKFLDMSNARREYTFDRHTNRLKGLKMYCRDAGKDVLVLEITKIEYDPYIADSQFQLQVPENAVWLEQPQALPDNEKYEKMTPAEAARTFFEACSKRDWDEAAKFLSMPITDDFKRYLGGLEIIKLGEPFQAKPYRGWFIPYEIRLDDGNVKKHTLSVRNDNPANRFVVDGGL